MRPHCGRIAARPEDAKNFGGQCPIMSAQWQKISNTFAENRHIDFFWDKKSLFFRYSKRKEYYFAAASRHILALRSTALERIAHRFAAICHFRRRCPGPGTGNTVAGMEELFIHGRKGIPAGVAVRHHAACCGGLAAKEQTQNKDSYIAAFGANRDCHIRLDRTVMLYACDERGAVSRVSG